MTPLRGSLGVEESIMAERKKVHDPIAELERLDRFYDGQEKGVLPLDVLRQRGIPIPADEDLSDAALQDTLWKVIEGMAAVGMYLEFTDHLSDRELYRYLMTALTEETILSEDEMSGWHLSPIGGCSEEDNEVWLRYYADDEERERWHQDTGDPLPPKATPPSDRDERMPDHHSIMEKPH
jgi:hypothetical protein